MDVVTEERLRNRLKARNSFRRRLRSKLKAKHRHRLGQQHNSKFEIVHSGKGKALYVDLLVPETLCLDTNFEESVEFVQTLRTVALTQRRDVRLVFENAKVVKASALLLLLAEMHRCRLVRGPAAVTGTYPPNQKVERMLCAMGFFDILKVKNRIVAKASYPMNYIKFASAAKLMEHQARQLRADLLGEKITMDLKSKKRLQRAITEAMLNAIQHAYPVSASKSNPGRNRWWLTGTFNRKTKDLIITFCDLGVGIPATVTKLYLVERIRAAVSLLPGIQISDGQMIMAAMKLGRTRTGEQGRGRGLNDLRKFIDHAGGGELKIFSKRGSYSYVSGGAEDFENYRHSIGGTLIKWRVPIANVTDWSGEDDGDDEIGD